MIRMRFVHGPLLPAWCLLFQATAGSAQTLTGQLVEQETGTPISAALVVLVDSTAREVEGVLTNEQGTFFLRAPNPGVYTLKAEHIGYRTTSSPTIRLRAGEKGSLRMEIPVQPVELGGLAVEVERECRVRPEEGLETAMLWEAARKTLNAVRWTERGRLFVYQVVRFERELDPRTLVVRRQRADTTWRLGIQPFVAADADDLVQNGFVQESPGDTSYYAPDAEVLLSEAFLDTHCFKARAGGETGLIGLAFEPVPDRSVTDVQGVLWLDLETGALRSLDYRYTDLHIGVPVEHFGGRVEFERLPTGAWIMGSWYIRGPIIQLSGPWLHRERRPKLDAIKEVGGAVLQAEPRDETGQAGDPSARRSHGRN